MVITDQTIELGTAFLVALGGTIYKLTQLAQQVNMLIDRSKKHDDQIHDIALATPAPAVVTSTGVEGGGRP